MMSRAGIFRVSGGVAVDMNCRVFELPSFRGTIIYSWLKHHYGIEITLSLRY